MSSDHILLHMRGKWIKRNECYFARNFDRRPFLIRRFDSNIKPDRNNGRRENVLLISSHLTEHSAEGAHRDYIYSVTPFCQ